MRAVSYSFLGRNHTAVALFNKGTVHLHPRKLCELLTRSGFSDAFRSHMISSHLHYPVERIDIPQFYDGHAVSITTPSRISLIAPFYLGWNTRA